MSVPPAIHVHASNRAEELVRQLAEITATPPGGVFTPECVVVQSRGMATWLAMRLAEHHGGFANGEFLYPRRFVERTAAAVLGVAVDPDRHGRARLYWAVLASLGDLLADRRFARLRHYVGEDVRGVRRSQLARRVASVFDRYLTYRPELIRAWQQGGEDTPGVSGRELAWQPPLWRAVVARLGSEHIAGQEPALEAALLGRGPLDGLPARVSVFGVSAVAPLFLRALLNLAHRTDVHLFQLAPTAEFWGDLLSPQQAARVLRAGSDPADLHVDLGHPLLASMGGVGAEFAAALMDGVEVARLDEQRHEAFVEPGSNGLLARLQGDLLHLRVPTAARPDRFEETKPRRRPRRAADHPLLPFADPKPQPIAVDPSDRSIRVHSCHGPMREVEVLRDQLLALLDTDPTLQPRDIVVMMADVEAYAPLVEAVFDREDRARIPMRIADRTVRSESPVVDAVLRVFAMVNGRAPVSEILDLLRLAPVHQRFRMAPAELDAVARWLSESAVRWGIDADHRVRHGHPRCDDNTWQRGLDRMLLGYAMPGDGSGMLGDVLPFDEIEGHDADLLGRLAEYAAVLFGWLERLARRRTVAEWVEAVNDLLVQMIGVDGDREAECHRIRDAMAMIAAEAADAGFGEPVDVAVLAGLLQPRLDEAHAERGFLGGGVTFCAFLPMRSIPFRVVCMLGMNDGAFPRQDRAVEFDLTVRGKRRPGDRSRRSDDRYLFLEALLSARDAVLITYTGQSIRDNRILPPSVVVAELLDAVCDAHGDPSLRRVLVVRHPLQPFSRAYFDGSQPELFSYEDSLLAGVEQGDAGEAAGVQLFTAPLAEEEPAAEIELDELVRFFRNPAAFLLNRALRVYLRDDTVQHSDEVPLELEPLETYSIGNRLLNHRLAGLPAAALLELERARGALPPGAAGMLAHEDVLRNAEEIVAAVQAAGGPGDGVHPVRLALPDGTRIVGMLPGVGPTGLVHCQFSRVSAKAELGAWIRHVVLCAVGPPGVAPRTSLVGRVPSGGRKDGDEQVVTRHFSAVEAPLERLLELVELYRMGQRAPLLLVPSTSLDLIHRMARGTELEPALRLVAGRWQRRGYDEQRYDEHTERVFGRSKPPFDDVVTVGPTFAEVACTVCGPMLHYTEERA